MHHILYRITNTINGRYYIGVHSTDNIDDGYFGSSQLLKRAIQKYGIRNFKKVILKRCRNRKQLMRLEKKLVVTVHTDPMSYNMNCGGHGGWDHINSNPNKVQPMHDPVIVKKVSTALKKKFAEDAVFREANRLNLLVATKKAAAVNYGKKRPDHAKFMRHFGKKLWKKPGYREKMHDCLRRCDYVLIDPNGNEIIVRDLRRFCRDRDFPFSTIWVCAIERKTVKRGPAKGWSAYTLTKTINR